MLDNFRQIIKEEIQSGNQTLLTEIGALNIEIANQKEELLQCKAELAKERQHSKKLQEKVLSMESYSRRDNLIFSGIPEHKGETSLDCEMKIIQVLRQAGLGNIHPKSNNSGT